MGVTAGPTPRHGPGVYALRYISLEPWNEACLHAQREPVRRTNVGRPWRTPRPALPAGSSNRMEIMTRIAIHGFGRIGRSLMKVALKERLFVPVSISDIKDVQLLAALFEVDSNCGRWPEEVTTKGGGFVIGGRQIPYFNSMKALPDWKALSVDLVIDCTGRATTRAGAQAHLDAGCWAVSSFHRVKVEFAAFGFPVGGLFRLRGQEALPHRVR